MFDLDISHYNKNELECLLSLPNKNYTREDVEKSTDTLCAHVQNNVTVTSEIRDKTVGFLVSVKDNLVGVIESNAYAQFDKDPLIENQNHFVMSRPITEVNPVKRDTVVRVVNVDSQFRGNLSTTTSSRFTLGLTNRVAKSVSMELSMFEPPSKIFNISARLGNNYFHVVNAAGTAVKITVPDGTYTDVTDIDFVTDNVNIDDAPVFANNALTIRFGGAIDFGDAPTAVFNLDPDGIVSSTPFYQRLGYMLGFRTETVDLTADTIVTTGEPHLNTNNYFFLAIDDFQNNVSSNFASTTDDQYLPPNTLARIAMTDLNNIVMFNGDENNTSPERKYFGPCDIQRIEVRLTDKYGRDLDTNGSDISFALTFKCVYD